MDKQFGDNNIATLVILSCLKGKKKNLKIKEKFYTIGYVIPENNTFDDLLYMFYFPWKYIPCEIDKYVKLYKKLYGNISEFEDILNAQKEYLK